MTLEEALARAPTLANQLDDATDGLNDMLSAVEAHLIVLHLGVRASVSIDTGVELEFGKYDKKWLLAISWPRSSSGAAPLTSTSRELRLLAASKLPELIVALVAEAKRQNDLVREARTNIAAILRTLTGGSK